MLGNYDQHPKFWDFSIDPKFSDTRVIKDKDNYATFEINEVSYTTQELYLDTNGSTFWTVQADFEIPNFEELFDSFLEIVAKGEVILRLGDQKFVSNKEENWELFEQ
jgi:hypothetical protein